MFKIFLSVKNNIFTAYFVQTIQHVTILTKHSIKTSKLFFDLKDVKT